MSGRELYQSFKRRAVSNTSEKLVLLIEQEKNIQRESEREEKQGEKEG